MILLARLDAHRPGSGMNGPILRDPSINSVPLNPLLLEQLDQVEQRDDTD
ncbi:MAG: hypothetical protein ACI8W3_000100 [Myxococcota bacterium]|jgi:hypothetical protein